MSRRKRPLRRAKAAQKSRRQKWVLLLALAAAVFLVVAISSIQQTEVKIADLPNAEMTLNSSIRTQISELYPIYFSDMRLVVPTPLQSLTAAETFMLYTERIKPVLSRVSESYPIPSVKQEVRTVYEEITSGRLPLSLNWNGVNFTKGFVTPSRVGDPRIGLALPWWKKKIELLDALPDQARARQLLEDLVIEVYTHEYCHVRLHHGQRASVKKENFTAAEAECWAYSSDQIIQPMVEAGRGPETTSNAFVYNFFYQSEGLTKDNPRWLQLMGEVATGKTPPASADIKNKS